MQPLNDDMDDLFRKAADDYPLNTGVPDWNRFAGAMANAGGKVADASSTTPGGKPATKNYRRYLWLLLLLPVMVVCNYVYNDGTDDATDFLRGRQADVAGNTTKKGDDQSKMVSGNATKNGDDQSKIVAGNATMKDDAQSKMIAGQQENDTKVPASTDPGLEATGTAGLTSAATAPETGTVTEPGLIPGRVSKAQGSSGAVGAPSANSPVKGKSSRFKNTGERELTYKQSRVNPGNKGSDADADNNITGANKNSSRLSSTFTYVETPGADGEDENSTDAPHIRKGYNRRAGRKNSSKLKTPGTQNTPIRNVVYLNAEPLIANPVGSDRFDFVSNITRPDVKGAHPLADSLFDSVGGYGGLVQPTPPKPAIRRFYIGAIGGLDLSTVKFQKFSKVGWHYGGIAGYQFAKKWSVEAGFFVDKKYYYTAGEYFNKGKLNLPSTSEVLWVDGDCLMYEIPVSVKYDIRNTFRSNWFVTAGFSSYFMKKEKYDMLYLYTGSGSTAVHKYEYKNSSSNYFSEVRLSGGYNYKLPGKVSIRVEPYINIPVSGVGYGKLNLFSGGLNVGLVRRF